MYLNKGKVFVNFTGTKKVRLVAVYMTDAEVSMVLVANLMVPGGKYDMHRSSFEEEFSEVVSLDDAPIDGLVGRSYEAGRKTNQANDLTKAVKKIKRKIYNPYSPEYHAIGEEEDATSL